MNIPPVVFMKAALTFAGMLVNYLTSLPVLYGAMAGFHLVMFAQSAGDTLGPSVFSLIGNGGVGIALIVVVRMFLQQQEATQRLQVEAQTRAFEVFGKKLDDIEHRHAADEQKRHAEMRDIIDRSLKSMEGLAVALSELRAAVDGLTVSNRSHETAIQSIEREFREYRQANPAAGRRARGDTS